LANPDVLNSWNVHSPNEVAAPCALLRETEKNKMRASNPRHRLARRDTNDTKMPGARHRDDTRRATN
jgi:hypothetical protein